MGIGDLVVRKKYDKDIVFKIKAIIDNYCVIEGVYIRLIADAQIDDLEPVKDLLRDESIMQNMVKKTSRKIKKNRGFMLGKILHIDGDPDYLNKCLDMYKEVGVFANGFFCDEKDAKLYILELILKYNPQIIVITGHDSYNKEGLKEINNYNNSKYFIETIKIIRNRYSLDDICIIAGACGSNFEALIASGANIATSPKRVNVHALDLSIVASMIACYPFNRIINLEEILINTYVKRDGIGGIETYGKLRLLL